MRAWLWILGAAATAAGAAAALARKKAREEALRRFLADIIASIDAGGLASLMNETPMDADGWSDAYAGMLDGLPLVFVMRVATRADREIPGVRRLYHVKWGDRFVQALVKPSAPGEPTHLFERFHDRLRDAYRRLASMPPPS